jgi:hypothetical protein
MKEKDSFKLIKQTPTTLMSKGRLRQINGVDNGPIVFAFCFLPFARLTPRRMHGK